MGRVTKEDLANQISELEEHRPGYTRPDLFVAWLLKALVTENEDDVFRALTNSPNDKDLDAVLVDHPSKTVFLVQGKYRIRGFGRYAEKRPDVISFSTWPSVLRGPDQRFDQRLQRMNEVARPAVLQARRHTKDGYSIHLVYATLGRCSQAMVDDADAEVLSAPDSVFELFDWKRIMLVLDDWVFGGVGPPVRRLSFPVEGGLLERPDPHSNIGAWVFSMRTADLADVYQSAGNRLFARNIRSTLGNTAVNRAIKASATKNPEYFWYFNNGVTVVCDDAVESKRAGQVLLNASNPQVINGQQTTVTLGELTRHSDKSSVQVKVIRVPRDTDQEKQRFDRLVSHIVEATNYQNPISTADLRSNDPVQIEIQRDLYRRGYQYIRKSGKGISLQALPGASLGFKVRKEELAAAIADCLSPALSRLAGPKRLFDLEHPHYDRIFANRSVDWRLACLWTKRNVEKVINAWEKTPERWQARLIVQYFLWNSMQPHVARRARRYVELSERWASSPEIRVPFNAACREVVRVATAAYVSNKGRGKARLEPSRYFNRPFAHEHFSVAWSNISSARKKRFQANLERVIDATSH